VSGRRVSAALIAQALGCEHGKNVCSFHTVKLCGLLWIDSFATIKMVFCSIVEIFTFASGQGLACPPLSSLRQVETCSMPSPVTSCDVCANGISDVGESDVDCGGNSTCTKCGEGKSCLSSTHCAANLLCSVNNTCICEYGGRLIAASFGIRHRVACLAASTLVTATEVVTGHVDILGIHRSEVSKPTVIRIIKQVIVEQFRVAGWILDTNSLVVLGFGNESVVSTTGTSCMGVSHVLLCRVGCAQCLRVVIAGLHGDGNRNELRGPLGQLEYSQLKFRDVAIAVSVVVECKVD
jgi:hypothetical protein